MKIRNLIFSILIILSLSLVIGETNKDLPALLEQSEMLQNIALPQSAQTLFGNEHLNLYVDGKLAADIQLEKGVIVTVGDGTDQPTMNVYTTSPVVEEILGNKITLEDALAKGKITYKGVGLLKKIKFGFVSLFQGWFLGGSGDAKEESALTGSAEGSDDATLDVDLQISEVKIYPLQENPEDPASYNRATTSYYLLVIVFNHGTENAVFPANSKVLSVGDQAEYYSQDRELIVYAQQPASFQIIPTAKGRELGNHYFSITLDPNNVVAETNEANNYMERFVNVE